MVDLDEIYRRAEQAGKKASAAMDDMMQRSQALAKQAAEDAIRREEEQREEEQQAGDGQEPAPSRQVVIAGQVFDPERAAQLFDPESAAQAAISEEQLQAMVQQQAAGFAALGAEGMMESLFGEDMGVIAAALETLAMERDDGEEDDEYEEDEAELDENRELELCQILEDKLARIEALPEPDPVPYGKEDARWERFGILLSGMISHLNGHELDGMDVEKHVPVLEQRIVSLVRRSWGIDGREELLDMIRYLTREGYVLRYQYLCEAGSPEELSETDEWDQEDVEERLSTERGWRFAQRFKERFSPEFMLGWDLGRAAMLARWGCYLGWITRGEANGILWDLSWRAAEGLHSWREFARSYLFGGLMWKLLQGAGDAESYLGYLEDAAVALLTGDPEQKEGQWKTCPWPEGRKMGFSLTYSGKP